VLLFFFQTDQDFTLAVITDAPIASTNSINLTSAILISAFFHESKTQWIFRLGAKLKPD